MRRLTVLTGPVWPLGTRARVWLLAQPAYLPLEVLTIGSAEADRRLGGVVAPASEDDLVVVSDDGAVWRGPRAWLMCLWALRAWRPWALRLAHPGRIRHAQRFLRTLAHGEGRGDRPWRGAPSMRAATREVSLVEWIARAVGLLGLTIFAAPVAVGVAALAVWAFAKAPIPLTLAVVVAALAWALRPTPRSSRRTLRRASWAGRAPPRSPS